jgi:predicted DsbA family dithiol-disulfide isomerase
MSQDRTDARTSRDAEAITVYADYVCPFCYLGKRSLETYLDSTDRELRVDWHPFDLRGHKRGPDGEIDHSVEDGKDESYFEQVRENVDRLRKEYGAEDMLDLDDLPEAVDSLNAQVASYHVFRESPDQWPAFDDAIYEALWLDGRDIGDVEVLSELADGVGLDGEAIRRVVSSEQERERVWERFEAARDRGVTGVPTFVYDEYSARGAVPPAHLERLVEGN